MAFKDLPEHARPREKLIARGAAALADTELLALLLRTGVAGKNVLQLAQELHERFGGLAGLLQASPEQLRGVRGMGGATKRAELVAVLELARRAMAEQLSQRAVFDAPEAVRQYVQMHIGTRPHEVFAVLFLDAQHRLIVLEELFRGTLTQTSVYPREVVLRALHHHAAASRSRVSASWRCTCLRPRSCWPTTIRAAASSPRAPTKRSRRRCAPRSRWSTCACSTT